MNVLPKGFFGELYITGKGISKGYLNQPDLTKERFVKLPHLPNSLFYRSGDYGRIMENGEIEFRGRMDEQVQIRGYRIELNEINHKIKNHPFVKDSIVSIFVDEQKDKNIVGYFVPIGNAKVVVKTSLYKDLAKELPSYMLPNFLVQLKEFPLTSNGKIDNNSLPSPLIKDVGKALTIYETETEKKLYEIWKKVLKHDNFSINDNFFEIGGHSLKAARISAIVYDEFGLDVKLGAFFDSPSIKELAEYIDVIIDSNDDLGENKTQIII